MVGNGWVVDVASKNDGTTIPYVNKQIDISIERSPFNINNFRAIKSLEHYINNEQYDIVNCHTPIGAMVARLAAHRARRNGTKVIYMTHGLHFYNGASRKNWLLYYNAEKWLARYTDAIITINSEDRANVRRFFNEIPHQYYLPGVGYDTNHIIDTNDLHIKALREEYGLNDNDFICLYIARYSLDKNHKFLIKAIKQLKQYIPNCKLLLLGDGEEMISCRKLAQELNIEKSVIFAGYQHNIAAYLQIAHVGVSPSISEGLGLGLVEEMCVGLPVVASRVRGHKDLIEDGVNGLLYTLNDTQEFIDKILYLYNNKEVSRQLGETARQNISRFSVENVISEMMKIFEQEMAQK